MAEPDPRLAQERREECRRLVLAHLVVRQAVACHPADIRRALNAGHENDFSLEEVEAALVFLSASEPPFARVLPHGLGATKYYQATTTGVLAHERGSLL